MSAGNVVTISKPGQISHTQTINTTPGTRQIIVPDVNLSGPVSAGQPVITRLEPRVDGIFLQGASVPNQYTAFVNWNGGTPGSVRFYANGALIGTQTGSGPEFTMNVDPQVSFPPSFRPGMNRLRVKAITGTGVESSVKELDVHVIPLPVVLQKAVGLYPFNLYGDIHLGLDVSIPDLVKNLFNIPPIKTVFDLPFLGKFGAEFAADISADYDIPTGDWELQVGLGSDFDSTKRGTRPSIAGLTRTPKMKLYLGNEEAEFRVYAKQEGRVSPTSGWEWGDFSLGLSLDTKFELTRFGVADLIGPGASTVLSGVPGLEQTLKNTSVIIWAKPGFTGAALFSVDPKFDFKTFEIGGKVGIEASYEPELSGNLKARIYIGGEPSVVFQHPGDLIKEAHFRLYAGLEVDAYFFTFHAPEVSLLNWDYPASQSPARLALTRLSVGESGKMLSLASRGYLAEGLERFVGLDLPGQAKVLDGTMTSLEAFRAVGRAKTSNTRNIKLADAGQAGAPSQADLALVQNVYPNSSPALAGRGQELMLLYAADNGSPNSLQFTDIKWSHYDGADWSMPAAILTDTRAEFAPQVAFDGNGDAIAVWERVADSDFNQTNLTAMLSNLEIVWARWSRTSGVWSTPVALTTNGVLDHSPHLCGPMMGGDLLLVWRRNSSNGLMGTNATGAVGNTDVLWRQWNETSQSWSAEQTLVANVAFELSESFGGVSNRAVYAWTRDLDGELTNGNDQQVFYREWTNGAWNTTTQLTSNGVGNRNVHAAVSADGGAYLVWQAGTNLVMSRNFTGSTSLVRSDSQTAGFADVALTVGPAGNLAVIWQEMDENGPNPHYRIYDPISSSWSLDRFLFADPGLERSFAPVWDDVGNLTMAYNRVDIFKTNKTISIAGGGSVTFTNVPQPGRVDLAVVKRTLVKDLALKPGDFTVDTENVLPGAVLMLTAKVSNVGDVAITNVTVGFYLGNPTNGGVLITNIQISGWLDGSSNVTASAQWLMPESGAASGLFAMIDPDGLVSEFTKTNNMQSLAIGGVDLEVSLVTANAQTNGALQVIAQVQNVGAPSAATSVIALRFSGQSGLPLVVADVPALEPGRLAQVALNIPAGILPEGISSLWLRADDSVITSDVNWTNNTASFAVNLWIDSDGDGVPDGWATQYFGHSTGSAGDLSRAQDDADGDGVSNLAEYLAGTNPKDASSYLRIGAITLGGTNGLQIVWGSATSKLYSVQRGSALGVGPSFTDLAQHILSTPPQNTYFDATATNSSAFFYRIKVE